MYHLNGPLRNLFLPGGINNSLLLYMDVYKSEFEYGCVRFWHEFILHVLCGGLITGLSLLKGFFVWNYDNLLGVFVSWKFMSACIFVSEDDVFRVCIFEFWELGFVYEWIWN